MAHIILAQDLYDLREATGFISGTDLHDLFRELCDGEPSPSGKIPVEIPEGHWVLTTLRSIENNLSKEVKEYYGDDGRLETSFRIMEQYLNAKACLSRIVIVS